MPSRKPPRNLVARNKNRRFEERRRGTPCGKCGLLAKRRSDRFCTNCGIPLTGVSKTISPDVLKAQVSCAVAEATTEITAAVTDARGELDRLRAASRRIAAQLAELELMVDGTNTPYRPAVSKAAFTSRVEPDPLAVLRVDGTPAGTDPLLREQLNSPDPTLREAAWGALFGKQGE